LEVEGFTSNSGSSLADREKAKRYHRFGAHRLACGLALLFFYKSNSMQGPASAASDLRFNFVENVLDR
jgi:hypothetical protein